MFQSSPAPKGRCNRSGWPLLWWPCCFNPHRPRRADATTASKVISFGSQFQSSPAPKGRCNGWANRGGYSSLRFNPHRPRRADATTECIANCLHLYCFNPHRPRRADATILYLTFPGTCRCFNPHRPRRADATAGHAVNVRDRAGVSILTGPEGPMQPTEAVSGNSMVMFQSSPAPKGRCNQDAANHALALGPFQSSPAPKGRCNAGEVRRGPRHPRVSILTGPEGPMQPSWRSSGDTGRLFQSSPAPKGRCNHAVPVPGLRPAVSILTGPEGPMQRITGGYFARYHDVSILTGPEGPMQRSAAPQSRRRSRRFNPHRPRRADATTVAARLHLQGKVSILTGPEGPMQPPHPLPETSSGCFNPHRPRRADATASCPATIEPSSSFQSSPAPKGRCNGRADDHSHRRDSFNPHRPRRADATGGAGAAGRDTGGFNPHRPRRADATIANRIHHLQPVGVSILTGPEGPMQPAASTGGLVHR